MIKDVSLLYRFRDNGKIVMRKAIIENTFE